MDFGLGSIGALLGMLGGLGTSGLGAYQAFGGGYKNPASEANKYISQIPGVYQENLNPYINAGKGAIGDLQNQYKDLLSGGVYDKLAGGYKESPGYQYQLEQALKAKEHAAAAGGMLGTPAHEAESMKTAQGLASQDFQNYLNSQLGLYGLGLSGEQGLGQMGFQGSNALSDAIGNALAQQAGYGYAGKAGENTAKSQGWQNIFSGLGQAGSSLMGGNFLSSLMGLLGQQKGTA